MPTIQEHLELCQSQFVKATHNWAKYVAAIYPEAAEVHYRYDLGNPFGRHLFMRFEFDLAELRQATISYGVVENHDNPAQIRYVDKCQIVVNQSGEITYRGISNEWNCNIPQTILPLHSRSILEASGYTGFERT